MNRGISYALLSALLFGVSTPLAKALVGEMSPLVLAGLLYAGSGVGLMLTLAGRLLRPNGDTKISLPGRTELGWLLAAIFLGGVVGPVALMYGLTTTAASTASLLLNLEAVFTALFAWFLFKESFDRRVVSGMVCIVAGGLLLAWVPQVSGRASIGAVLITLACTCWALDNNLTRKVAGSDAVFIAGAKGLVAGAVNLALGLLLLGHSLPDATLVTKAMTVGFLGYGVSLVLFVLALRLLGSARAGAYFSVAPFFGAAIAFAMQGEVLTWGFVAAGAPMALGVWLHVTEHHAHRHTHEALEHSHMHSHDDHHRHSHASWDGRQPHAHAHVHAHAPLVHSHVHYPDVHHRHPH